MLPNGRRHTNPAVGKIDFDEARALLRGYVPHPGEPLAELRAILDEALA